MAELSLVDRAYALARRFRFLHSLLRRAKACFYALPAEFFRLVGAGTVRMGAARGFFERGEPAPGMGETILRRQEVHAASRGTLRGTTGQNDQWQPWPIFWARYREARLVGTTLALLDEKKRLLLDSVWSRQSAERDPANNYLFLSPAVRLEGAWTSVVARWTEKPGYYHWLMDALPRLALLEKFPEETRILVPPGLKKFHTEILKLLGLEGRCRVAEERHLVVEDYYFSSPTAMTGCDNPYAVRHLRESLLKHADPAVPACEKLFIRRSGKTRGIVNEQEVLDFFEGRGWTVLDMEQFTVAQQIGIFSNLRMVCGQHGAAFTNLLWCRPGCKALELFPTNFLNGCYEGIASYVGVEHRYMLSPGDHHFTIKVEMKALETMVRAME